MRVEREAWFLGHEKKRVRGPSSSVLDIILRPTTLMGEWTHTRGLGFPWKFQMLEQKDGVYTGEPEPVIFVLSCSSYFVHIIFVLYPYHERHFIPSWHMLMCGRYSLNDRGTLGVSPAISQFLNLTNQQSRGYILRWDMWSARLCLSQRARLSNGKGSTAAVYLGLAAFSKPPLH